MADPEKKEPAATATPAPPPPAPSPPSDDPSENIPHPYAELYRHTIMRGANLGSVLSLILAPPYLWFKGVRSPGEFLKRTGSITAKGMAFGVLFGVVMTHMTIRKNEEERVYDRCYRLRHNKGQVRTDKFTYGGLALGGLGGVAAGMGGGPLMGGIQGASVGAGLAVLAHVLTKKKEDKK